MVPYSQHSQCLWNSYSSAWPSCHEPCSGCTMLTTAVCSGAQVSRNSTAVFTLLDNIIFHCLIVRYITNDKNCRQLLYYILCFMITAKFGSVYVAYPQPDILLKPIFETNYQISQHAVQSRVE